MQMWPFHLNAKERKKEEREKQHFTVAVSNYFYILLTQKENWSILKVQI